MKFVKETFLKLNTYTQIQVGVIAVTACILIISICLLSIISLTIINSAYSEILSSLEMKENDQINSVSIYFDTHINVATDLGKIIQYNTRSFFENNARNHDFMNNIISNNFINNFSSNLNTITSSQIYEKCYTYEDPITKLMKNNSEDPKYAYLKKMISSFAPIIAYTRINSFYKVGKFENNYENVLLDNISFYSYRYKCVFFHTKKEEYIDYNYADFIKYLASQVYILNTQVRDNIDKYTEYKKTNDLTNTVLISPFTSFYYKPATNLNDNSNIEKVLIVTSPSFIRNENQNAIENYSLNDLDNLFSFDYSKITINNLIIKNLKKFKSFKALVVSPNILISQTTCGILKNIFYFYNQTNLLEQSPSLNNINDCFLLKSSENQTYFESSFNSKNNVSTTNSKGAYFRSFVKIPLALDKKFPEQIERGKYYKILRFTTVDIITRLLLNSNFSVWFRPSGYIIKSYALLKHDFDLILQIFIIHLLRIIAFNIIISFIIIFIVSYISVVVSKSIGNPIKILINVIKNINLNENGDVNEKAKSLDQIRFEDDEIIDKFFAICKKLIKGGLADENIKYNKIQYNDDAYNNVAYMKYNNLIVQEEKIMKESNQRVDRIFNHSSVIEKIKNNPEEILKNSNKKIQVSYKNINSNNKNNSEEINSIKIERVKNPEKNALLQLGSEASRNEINKLFDREKVRVEYNEILNEFNEKKEEVQVYFQNTESNNMNFNQINFIINANLHNNINKNIDHSENELSKEDSEFDNIIRKYFKKENLDKLFELLKKYS